MIRIGRWFKQRPTTLWTIYDSEALSQVNPTEDELAIVEKLYTAPSSADLPFKRTSISTLLNHWAGEVNKATTWASTRRRRGPNI